MDANGAALVTGASRGIGQAVALELAKRGFDVVATMRNPADGEALRSASTRGRIQVEALDVNRPETIRIPDGLRVLVNNAGVEGEHLPVEHAPMQMWRDIFETNFFGLVEVTRRALPELRASRGVLCNVTSCSILVPMPFFAVYRASKAAVSALGESLRAEVQDAGVRVLEIQPGAIETDMLEGSKREPEAMAFEAYRTLAKTVHAMRQAGVDQFESVENAAVSIVDAILDDATPLRHGPDPMGAGLLAAWRATDDETMMGGMLASLAPPPNDD